MQPDPTDKVMRNKYPRARHHHRDCQKDTDYFDVNTRGVAIEHPQASYELIPEKKIQNLQYLQPFFVEP